MVVIRSLRDTFFQHIAEPSCPGIPLSCSGGKYRQKKGIIQPGDTCLETQHLSPQVARRMLNRHIRNVFFLQQPVVPQSPENIILLLNLF